MAFKGQCVTLITNIRTYPVGCHMNPEISHMWVLQSPVTMKMRKIKPTTYCALHYRLEATRSKRVYDPIVKYSRTGERFVTLEIEYWL